MIWLYLLSLTILLGFEINASIDEARYGVSLEAMGELKVQ
jgi:uncharacterized BrkB/YihY/UPF0761 family membrane protein